MTQNAEFCMWNSYYSDDYIFLFMPLRFLGSWNDKGSDVSDIGSHNLKYKYQQNKGKAIPLQACTSL